ncbi:MAG: hypothetical protein KatS3mg103_0045 [Phycisphaerales bacterium]|nr:MAG: hypothetical protein KatS3mg103_0045 [Phycisphaerales bacterium]
MRRLRLALATSVRLGVPAGEIRSELWRSRTAQGRIAVNPAHRDFPALLAEALDVLFAARLDVRRAATRLGVSPTQLVRLVAKHPPRPGRAEPRPACNASSARCTRDRAGQVVRIQHPQKHGVGHGAARASRRGPRPAAPRPG